MLSVDMLSSIIRGHKVVSYFGLVSGTSGCVWIKLRSVHSQKDDADVPTAANMKSNGHARVEDDGARCAQHGWARLRAELAVALPAE